MSQETERHEMTKRRVVYRLPGEEGVTVRQDVEDQTTDAGAQTLEVYYPAGGPGGGPQPAVVFVSGYPDPGFQKMFGCKLKEMESYVSWGRLAAASGMIAVTYSTGRDPAADAQALLEYVRQNALDLGIDRNRLGVWACSGNVPNALGVLLRQENVELGGAVLCCGLMLDLDGDTSGAEAAGLWGFATPGAGKSAADLPRD